MSDIVSFGTNDLFLMGLTLFAPLVFFGAGLVTISAEKRRVAKVLFYLAGIYTFLVLTIPVVIIFING